MRPKSANSQGKPNSPRWATGTTRHTAAYLTILICTLGISLCVPLHESMLSILLTLVAVVALTLVDLRAILVLAYPIMTLTGVLISLGVIEQGAYITEQQRYGKNIGATPIFALYMLAFLIIAFVITRLLLTKRFAGVHRIRATPLIAIIAGISVASGIFYCSVFLLYGIGLDFEARFEWMQTLPPLLVKIHLFFGSFAIPAAFTVAGIVVRIFGLRVHLLWILTLAIPIIALIGTGEKYSAFTVAICMTLTGIGIGSYALGEDIRIKFRWRYVAIAAALAAVLAVTVIAGYLRMGTSVDEIWKALSVRLALQGHVWFGIYDRFGGEPGISVAHLLRPNEHDSPGGLDYLSYLVADHNYVYQRIGRGISFTMGGPPGILAAFGTWWGLLIYGLLGSLYAVAASTILQFLNHRAEILITVGVILYVTVGATTQMGRWDTAYGTVAIAAYGVGILGAVYVIWRRRREKRIKLTEVRKTRNGLG